MEDSKKKLVDMKAVIDPAKKEKMMAILIQNEGAFRAVVGHLRPEYFPAHEIIYAVLWKTVCAFYEEHGELPDYALLEPEIQDSIGANPEMLNDTEVDELDQFLEYAYDPASFQKDPKDSDIYQKWTVSQAKRFMQERLAQETKDLVYSQNTVAVNLSGLLGTQQAQAEALDSLSGGAASIAFPEGFDKRIKINVTSTGMSFLDNFLGGGDVAGEIYGILGPYGSCKTTLTAMLAVEAAKRAEIRLKEAGELRMVFIVSYEAREKELQNRTLGYAAKIHRRTLEDMESFADLSREHELLAYEKKLFRSKIQRGKRAKGEYGRVQSVIPWMNRHLVFLDMTGSAEGHRGAGGGGLKEVSQRISHELRLRPGAKCELVVLDYVNAMVKRHVAAAEISGDKTREIIAGTPLLAKAGICDVFDCPLWLLQQMSGEANAKGTGAQMHHTDAAECKSFAENLDFAMVLGKPNPDNICTFACTKHRRRPPLETNIIKIDGAFNRVLDMSGRFVLDTHTRKIISTEDMGRLAGHEDAAAVPSKNTPKNVSLT